MIDEAVFADALERAALALPRLQAGRDFVSAEDLARALGESGLTAEFLLSRLARGGLLVRWLILDCGNCDGVRGSYRDECEVPLGVPTPCPVCGDVACPLRVSRTAYTLVTDELVLVRSPRLRPSTLAEALEAR